MYKTNLVIDQGTDFSVTFNVTDETGLPLNLAGYTGAAQLRKHHSSVTDYPFVVTINATAGSVTLSLDNANTSSIEDGRYVYDVELTSSTNAVSRPFGGQARVTPEVTR